MIELSNAALAVPDKSIAVLPLENLSDDKENAFFADGIHEDILTSLDKIRDLKVISGTSVMNYRSAARNLFQLPGRQSTLKTDWPRFRLDVQERE